MKPPTKTKREEVVEALAEAINRSSWWAKTDKTAAQIIAEAALDYLKAKMPIVHPCGAETPSYYRALSDVRKNLFGEA
jgi:hypothetical protein